MQQKGAKSKKKNWGTPTTTPESLKQKSIKKNFEKVKKKKGMPTCCPTGSPSPAGRASAAPREGPERSKTAGRPSLEAPVPLGDKEEDGE